MTEPIARPFDAYLPRPDLASQVVSLPYDSLPTNGTLRQDEDSQFGFLNLIRSEVDHPALTGEGRRALLGAAAARLRTIIGEGLYEHHPAPVFFVCRLSQGGHSQTGVIADVPLVAYDAGKIKVHELTRKGQEDRLVEYMQLVRANFLPLFLVHRPLPAIDAARAASTAGAPAVDVDAGDGLRITVWVVDDPAAVRSWEEALAGLGHAYVADGHHRAAAASRFAAAQRAAFPDAGEDEPWQRVLAVLFQSDQLRIHAYHRCLADLGDHDAGSFLAELGARFPLQPLAGAAGEAARPRRRGEVAVHVGTGWWMLTLPPALLQRPGVAGLDVTVLHDEVLAPLAGVTDARTDPRLEFVPGTLGMEELERLRHRGWAAAFALHPVSVDELLDVADRHETMPPKSTWFAPKLRSGLVVRLL